MKYVFRKKPLAVLAGALDAAGRIAGARRPVRPFPASPKKILLVRLDHLGDILPSTGLPQLLKESFPGSEMHFLTNSAGEALLKNNPYVDRIWVFNPDWYTRRGRQAQGGMKYGELVRALRREKIDLAFSLRGDARENWLLRVARVGWSLGYGITGGGFLLDRTVRYDEGAHESKHTLDLLAYAGVNTEGLRPKIYFSDDEKRSFEESLRCRGLEPGHWIGIQADAGTEAKEWPLDNLERFISLCESVCPDLRIAFVGSDPGRAQWLERRLGSSRGARRISLVGKTDLRELFYLIRSLKCFIGPDSGPAHVAAAFGVPTLFLASGTNLFELWKPAENADFLRHPVPCSPCHLVRCPVNGHPCMGMLTPDKVFDWLKERNFA